MQESVQKIAMTDINIKLIALDLDGTALDSRKRFSMRLQRAVSRAAEKGVRTVIATGRPFCAVPADLLTQKHIDYVITTNGARVTHLPANEELFVHYLLPGRVQEILAVALGQNLHIDVFSEGNAYIDEKEYAAVMDGSLATRDALYVRTTRVPVHDIYALLEEKQNVIEGICFNYRDLQEKADATPLLRAIEDTSLTSSFSLNHEIGAAHVSKAYALSQLEEHLDIASGALMACGDSINDLEMLEMAALSVAMANADEKVKQAASFVTDSNNEDGVAKAIEKFVLQ